jgi:hypothetical protein
VLDRTKLATLQKDARNLDYESRLEVEDLSLDLMLAMFRVEEELVCIRLGQRRPFLGRLLGRLLATVGIPAHHGVFVKAAVHLEQSRANRKGARTRKRAEPTWIRDQKTLSQNPLIKSEAATVGLINVDYYDSCTTRHVAHAPVYG